jgi:hypothetical protein
MIGNAVEIKFGQNVSQDANLIEEELGVRDGGGRGRGARETSLLLSIND